MESMISFFVTLTLLDSSSESCLISSSFAPSNAFSFDYYTSIKSLSLADSAFFSFFSEERPTRSGTPYTVALSLADSTAAVAGALRPPVGTKGPWIWGACRRTVA